jgi:hypothetical protein
MGWAPRDSINNPSREEFTIHFAPKAFIHREDGIPRIIHNIIPKKTKRKKK